MSEVREAGSSTIWVAGGHVAVSVYEYQGPTVIVEAEDLDSNVTLYISPAEAVRLSRALVAAAAEALGVRV